MCGIGMAQGMHGYFLFNARLFYGLCYSPLYASLRIAAIKVTALAALYYSISFAVEQPLVGTLCFYIFLNATCKHFTHGHIAIFLTLTLAHMHHAPVKVNVTNQKTAHFKATQATIV